MITQSRKISVGDYEPTACRDLAANGSSQNAEELQGEERLFRALVSGCHVENAALVAGLSERTVYRRLRDPNFRKELDDARQSLRQSILARLADAGHDAIGVMVELMGSEDESVRLKAAKAVLDALTAYQRSEGNTSDTAKNAVRFERGAVTVYVPTNGREATGDCSGPN